MSDFGSKAKDLFDKTVKDIDKKINENADKIKDGIGKAGDFVDQKTGGKYTDKVDDLQTKAGAFVDSRSAEAQSEPMVDPTMPTAQPDPSAPTVQPDPAADSTDSTVDADGVPSTGFGTDSDPATPPPGSNDPRTPGV